METTNLNATLDCIKETTTLTTRIITNVCTGTITNLPIGFWDFVAYGGLGLLLGGLVLVLGVMMYKILTDY